MIKRLFLSLSVLFSAVHWLPAPIQEVPETPARAPEQLSKPKPKGTVKPKTSRVSSLQPKSEAAPDGKPFNIPQSQMTASATSQHRGYEASKAIDGNSNSLWATPWSLFAPLVSLPQSIVLNLGGTYYVNTLHYLPRQDVWANGTIVSYRIYASTDGAHFTLITGGDWPDDHTQKTATFAPTRASQIRLEAVAGHGGFVAVAELNLTATR